MQFSLGVSMLDLCFVLLVHRIQSYSRGNIVFLVIRDVLKLLCLLLISFYFMEDF